VRRVSFDLVSLRYSGSGRTFVNDRRSDAYERLVDRLLASPHYSNAGRSMADLARWRSTVLNTTNRATAWRS
jgi:hypothetical protein